MAKIIDWIEDNPVPAGGVVVAGGLVLLWAFGFFKSAPTQTADPNAAAYYAASATQAQFGAAMQIATINSAAATAQAGIAANAATTINGQNTGAATTIAGLQNDTATKAITATDYQAWLNQTLSAYSVQTAQSIAGYQTETNTQLSATQQIYNDAASARATAANTAAITALSNTSGYANSNAPTYGASLAIPIISIPNMGNAYTAGTGG